ncbi:MAG: hypothetical protein B7Y43_00955 [Sphingomonas sp. 28-62-20]|nr:MAG: hypothetical protein B7Y43_00955 [Sphingomonas sp. 28-62-20]
MASLFLSAQAHAEWLEAKTSRFTIYGNMSTKKMQLFGDRLARFDAVLRSLLTLPPAEPGENNPVTIYVVRDIAAVQRLHGRSGGNIAGYYDAVASGPYAVMPQTTDDGDFTWQVLFHEYVHHLTLGNSDAYYPGWVAEGLAEFFGTPDLDRDDSVKIGLPNNVRAASILSGSPMPVAMLVADRWLPDGPAVDQKYARGWLLIHYLLLGHKRPGQFKRYMVAANSGMTSLEAAKAVFGDLHKLDGELNAYRSGKITVAVLPVADLHPEPVTLRRLDPAETAIMPLRIRSATGVDVKEAAALVDPARRIAEAYPDHPWVQRVAAEIDLDAGRDADAEAACDGALAVDPRNVDALIIKGRIHSRRAVAAKAASPEIWREARSWYLKANRIDPNYALPFMLFYDSFVAAGQPPTANAVEGLLRAAKLVPQDDGLRIRVTMAMLARGNLPAARQMLRPLAYGPHRGGDNPAAKLLALLEATSDPNVARAAAAEAGLKSDPE